MDKQDNSIESQIAAILADIRQKGFSSVRPFVVGMVEERMMQFAEVNGIPLGSNELYMSAKQLQHCMRASKSAKGLVVADTDLIGFPQNRFKMDLYYDGECFIYTDGVKETKRQGRIAHHHTDATVPHIVALLGFSFHAAKIWIISECAK